MAYKSDRVDVSQMFDELVTSGRSRHEAAVELGSALTNGAIALEFAGELVIEEIAPIAQCLRDFAADPRFRPAGSAVARWVTVMQKAEASRAQFEATCQLSTAAESPLIPNRRIISDEALVAEAVEGLRSDRWPNIYRAAVDLAPRAEGQSQESKVRRLRDKIKKAMN